MEKIITVAGGLGAYYAIDDIGRLWSFGSTRERLGRNAAEEEKWVPGVVPLPGRAVSVSANGDAHYALLEDGTVWSWGYRNGGQLGGAHRDGKWRMLPERIEGLSRIKLIASSSGGAAIDEDGRIFVWGVSAGGPPPPPPSARDRWSYAPPKDNLFAKSVLQPDGLWSPHALTAHAFAKPVKQLVDGMSTYALLDANGDVWYWNSNRHGLRGTGITVDRPDKEYWLTPEKSAWNAN